MPGVVRERAGREQWKSYVAASRYTTSTALRWLPRLYVS